MRFHVLFNPHSGNGDRMRVKRLYDWLDGNEVIRHDVLVESGDGYSNFYNNLQKDDAIMLLGGDGTLNRFINYIKGDRRGHDLYYYPVGTGNDFWKDIGKTEDDDPVCINKYVENLPSLEINGQVYLFINGIGAAIDGYCCAEGNRNKHNGKKVNYTAIAIKGLLGRYKPQNVEVSVDGAFIELKKVWLAPVMLGKFFGGGMMPAPYQDRLNSTRTLSLCMMKGCSGLHALAIFPKLFKGEHTKKKKYVTICEGREFTVKMERPYDLQIDGETIENVESFTVKF